MAEDYIPSNDPEAIVQGKARVSYAQSNLAALGLVAADVSPLSNAIDEFESGLSRF
jgi:hypothetical protein